MLESIKVVATLYSEDNKAMRTLIKGDHCNATISTDRVSPEDDTIATVECSSEDLIADLPLIATSISLHHAALVLIALLDASYDAKEVAVKVLAKKMGEEGRFVIYQPRRKAPAFRHGDIRRELAVDFSVRVIHTIRG